MFFNIIADHLEMACKALYLLRQERENKAYGQASALRFVAQHPHGNRAGYIGFMLQSH